VGERGVRFAEVAAPAASGVPVERGSFTADSILENSIDFASRISGTGH